MEIINKVRDLHSDVMQRRFGFPNEFGDIMFGESQYGDANPYSGVYQIRHRKGRQIVVRMRFAYPKTYTTEPAIYSKALFRNANIYWKAHSGAFREPWIRRAKGTNLLPHNVFIRDVMKGDYIMQL